MKIRITESCLVSGQHAEAGTVHDVSEGEALVIIGAGRAVRHVESAPVAAAEQVQAAAPVRDVQTAARPRRVAKPVAAS